MTPVALIVVTVIFELQTSPFDDVTVTTLNYFAASPLKIDEAMSVQPGHVA